MSWAKRSSTIWLWRDLQPSLPYLLPGCGTLHLHLLAYSHWRLLLNWVDDAADLWASVGLHALVDDAFAIRTRPINSKKWILFEFWAEWLANEWLFFNLIEWGSEAIYAIWKDALFKHCLIQACLPFASIALFRHCCMQAHSWNPLCKQWHSEHQLKSKMRKTYALTAAALTTNCKQALC